MIYNYDYVRKTYGVPAKTGCRIRYTYGDTPKMGTIVACYGETIGIKMDGETYIGVYHPIWKIEYLDEDGNELVKDN